MRDLNTFFKKIYQKWKFYREKEQDFERFLIFLNIKISAKSGKKTKQQKKKNRSQ